MRATWPQLRAGLVWVVLMGPGILGCVNSRATSPREVDFGPRPPPRPGSSISHTRMCECRACHPRACCGGADETQAECNLDAVTADAETMNFDVDEACGIEVQSCTQRCTIEVWRVGANESCETRRPEECCMASGG